MKVRFVGAINGVTGSCTHFDFSRTGVEFLVDCGMSQGEPYSEAHNAREFPFSAKNLKFVILTHGHMDHCGLIPKLYRDGFKGKVICTSATAKIAKVALLDSLKFSKDLYDKGDVEAIQFDHFDARPDFGLSRPVPIDTDLFLSFLRSAHILGSVSVTLRWMYDDEKWRQMVLSGDLGNNTKKNSYQSLLASRQSPFGFPNYILTESTYGDRVRDPKFKSLDSRIEALSDIIDSAFETGDTLLIPAFALQRTQEVLFDIHHAFQRNSRRFSRQLASPVDVFVHAKLARQFTPIFGEELCKRQILKAHETLYRNRRMGSLLELADESEVDAFVTALFPANSKDEEFVQFPLHSIRYTNRNVHLREADSKRIIITGGGMCNGGPIVMYLNKLIEDSKTTILLTGYMAKGSLGHSLAQYASWSVGERTEPFGVLEIEERSIDPSSIAARVVDMKSYYSGHADRDGIVDFVFSGAVERDIGEKAPVTVFINHGDNQSRNALKLALENHKPGRDQRTLKQVIVPLSSTDWFDLDAGEWLRESNGSMEIMALLDEQRRTNALLGELVELLKLKLGPPEVSKNS